PMASVLTMAIRRQGGHTNLKECLSGVDPTGKPHSSTACRGGPSLPRPRSILRTVSDNHGPGGEDNRDGTLLGLVFRHLPGAVWAVDRRLSFTYVAGRLVDAAGLRATEVVGTTVQDFLGTRDPTDPGLAHHLAALAGERQSFEYRYRDRWYAVLIDPMPGPDGT